MMKMTFKGGVKEKLELAGDAHGIIANKMDATP
jgi:hypothetical protein